MLEIRLIVESIDGGDLEPEERATFSSGRNDDVVWIEIGGRCVSVGKREFLAVAKIFSWSDET